MSYTVSRFLNRRQLNTIERIGNILVPSHSALPKFSDTGCLFHIDTMLEACPADDVRSLKAVLMLLSILPDAALHWLCRQLEKSEHYSGWLFAQLRLLKIGLRGIIFSLYYSGQNTPYNESTVHKAIGYQVHCSPDSPPRGEIH